jgi:hypothetical protein
MGGTSLGIAGGTLVGIGSVMVGGKFGLGMMFGGSLSGGKSGICGGSVIGGGGINGGSMSGPVGTVIPNGIC